MKFAHIRIRDLDTSEILPCGGVTYCYNIINGNLYVSVAQCNMRDNYNKRIGRAISQGRMEAGIYLVFPLPSGNIVDFLLDNV